jgi:hypothetical protein
MPLLLQHSLSKRNAPEVIAITELFGTLAATDVGDKSAMIGEARYAIAYGVLAIAGRDRRGGRASLT